MNVERDLSSRMCNLQYFFSRTHIPTVERYINVEPRTGSLLELCRKSEWQDAVPPVQRLNSHPNEAKHNTQYGDLPLHSATWNNASVWR